MKYYRSLTDYCQVPCVSPLVDDKGMLYLTARMLAASLLVNHQVGIRFPALYCHE